MSGIRRNLDAIAEALPAIILKERQEAFDSGMLAASDAIWERIKKHKEVTEGYSTSADHYAGLEDAINAIGEAWRKLRP